MAIDANLESLEEDSVLQVFSYLKKLRQARRGLVESLVSPTNSLGIYFHVDFYHSFALN